MSEPFKIRVGSKSNKGTLKSENDDRILIGMDPAANDWLFSPDPVQVGEFGTVLLLADGLGDNENGGSAAQAICKTIKKLFDETLELPPYDDEKLRLLLKFFQIAQKQLQTQSLENPSHKNIGASATLVLLLENKAFIVWLGNCRAYRYNAIEPGKSFFSDQPNLELLTVDHTFETEKVLFDEYREQKYFYPSGISKYVSTEVNAQEISATIVSLKKRDRILICSEGLFSSLSNENIREILGTTDDPELTADELISRAFNTGTEKNISAIVTDILEIEAGIPAIENPDISLIEKARMLYGAPIANQVLAPVPKETPVAPIKKEKGMLLAEDLVPVKLRTVMPDPELNTPTDKQTPAEEQIPAEAQISEEEQIPIDDETEKNVQASGQIAIEWPVEQQGAENDQPVENEEIEEELEEETENEEQPEEDTADSIITPLAPESPQSQIQGEMAERLARLKIKMTVYPDPEDRAQEINEKSVVETNIDLTEAEDKDATKYVSIDLNDEMETNDELEENEGLQEPSEDIILDYTIANGFEEERDEAVETDLDTEEFSETPVPFTGTNISESKEPILESAEEDEEETISEQDEEENEFEEDLPEEEEIDTEADEEQEEENEEQETEDEQEDVIPVVASEIEFPDRPSVSETAAPGTIHAGTPVQKPIAHLITAEKDDSNTGTSEKKSKLWPYFVVLGFLILIPIWICRDNSGLSTDNNMYDASAAIPIGEETTENQPEDIIPLESEPEQEPAEEEVDDADEDETEIVNPPAAVVPDPETEKPKEKKKEETKPKSDSRQPKYDADVEKNKHQLLGEVQALLQQKNQLCKQISTYGKNAPESKSESIKQVQNKCDQLGQKFSSIYDQKSGYFKTVRYDFMKGTIKSIRVSLEQIDQQFKAIREE